MNLVRFSKESGTSYFAFEITDLYKCTLTGNRSFLLNYSQRSKLNLCLPVQKIYISIWYVSKYISSCIWYAIGIIERSQPKQTFKLFKDVFRHYCPCLG